MSEGILSEIQKGLPGPGRLRYTERAYRLLPPLTSPVILDIGCGDGVPTMALARLSGGRVTGIDTDRMVLDRFTARAANESLSDRVTAQYASMSDIPFEDGHFDVVWSEGSIQFVGFEHGLRRWRRLLKRPGYLVVHESCWLRPDPPPDIKKHWGNFFSGITTVPGTIEIVERCGYDLIGHFALPSDAWWVEYYGPLEERLKTLREKHAGDRQVLELLEKEQREIDIYRKSQKWFGSAYFIMRNK
jgi:SAM-dependent methyltransferase